LFLKLNQYFDNQIRIPLILVDGTPRVNAILFSNRYHFGLARITFVVDTGSNATFIGEEDFAGLQISMDTLHKEEAFKMAGSEYNLLLGKEGTLLFKTNENKTTRIDLPNIPVAKTTSKKASGIEGIPSILGTDFLEKNKFALYFNPNKDIMYLEKEEGQ